MTAPQALSVSEIRNYMLANGGRVSNHGLVKYFKSFLTGEPEIQKEARRQFKIYVNVLATIKNENNQKYLILRKKYVNECPTQETIERAMQAAAEANVPSSPGETSIGLDNSNSFSSNVASPRQPPPYKPPPEVVSPKTAATPVTTTSRPPPPPLATGIIVQKENVESYGEVVQEFSSALKGLGRIEKTSSSQNESKRPSDTPSVENVELRSESISRSNSVEATNQETNKENIPRFSFSSGASGASTVSAESANTDAVDKPLTKHSDTENDNPMSVKEATRKFNRMASEEEAKVVSPPAKKKPENVIEETKDDLPPVTYTHPKAKEWIVAMAKANHYELAKLAKASPELVRLLDPATGYTALHWAAKHGKVDVIKLIAGTYKADVNARSNGGYTPLHLSVQFGRNDVFQMLCNDYKANRDLTDWSGSKPLDYMQQQTSVSASTYSKIKARRKHAVERDLSFLRIGSLNVRVKKTTEAFSNFLGVGGNGNGAATMPLQHHRRRDPIPAMKTASQPLGAENSRNGRTKAGMRSSEPDCENTYKSWGSVDNIPIVEVDDTNLMPPPKGSESVKKRQKMAKRGSVTSSCPTDSPRHSISSSNSGSNLNSGYSSMPTTPNQLRSVLHKVDGGSTNGDSDSDSACGFGSHWSVGGDGKTEKP